MASKGTVLITGVNGFIASRTAETFLQAGFSVRGTVRKFASGKALQEVLAQYGSKLELVEVPDITIDGAFDKAVQGVTAILHMASPVSFSFTDPDYVINTAVHGTTSILASALKAGQQLKNVVYISSIAAIAQPHDAPYTYTEKDWQEWAPAEVKKLGGKSPGPVIYTASKALAERAFWKFRDEEKPSFTMTAINPGFVMGPPLVLPKDPSQLSETVIAEYTILSGAAIPPPLSPRPSFIDNRDVARLMLFAVTDSHVANGERYITIAGAVRPQAIADVLNKHYPEKGLQKGTPGEGYEEGYVYPEGGIRIDSSKAVKATGKQWIGFEESVLDTAKAFERYL